LHIDLLEKYATYISLKTTFESRRVALTTANAAAAVALERSLRDIGAAIHTQLKQHDLEESEPITGELLAGSALTDAGGFNNSQQTDTGSGTVLAHIAWETGHYGAADKPSGSDIHLRGKVGLQPALTLLKTSGSTEANAATHQEALVFDGGLEFGFFKGSTESTLLMRGGLVRIGDPAVIVTENGQSTLAVPAGTTATVTPYFEAGGNFALHSQPLIVAHLAKTTLSPRLFVEYALRRDSRLGSAGSLTEFSHPEWGYVVRAMLDGVQIKDKRTEGENNTTFAISVGVEYQKSFEQDIPYGFQFIVRGDLDLLKALKGGHVEKPPQ
jgi:hypothetical protein